MPDRNQKTPKNVAGKFYVDRQCLTHAMCQHLAPRNFAYDEESGCYYVCKQPETSEELASAWRLLLLVRWRLLVQMERKVTTNKRAFLFIFLILAPTIRAAEYVEITTELNSTWHSSTTTNHYSNIATCIVGTNDWFISGDFLKNADVEYWLVGTNVVERKVITTSMYLQQAKNIVSEKILGRKPPTPRGSYPRPGETFITVRPWLEPFGYGEERAIWLAFCSGKYLKQQGRQVPMPLGYFRDACGYSDKTVLFGNNADLPKEVGLYAANGQLVCEYKVLRATNYLGRVFPLEFRLIQYSSPDRGRAPTTTSKSVLLGRVTAMKIGKRPAVPNQAWAQTNRLDFTPPNR